MLCALLVSAFAAQSASAISGTTAFTCVNVGAGNGAFSDDHCKTTEANGTYKHETISDTLTTELTGNNNGESTKLKATVAGAATTLVATGLSGTGTMQNKVAGSGEHYGHGEGTINYTGVTVSGFSGKCHVFKDVAGAIGTKGAVDTETLTATTEGQGHLLKFTPKSGEVFARFWILDAAEKTSAQGGECNIGATYTVTGSVKGTVNGATTTTTHADTTTQNTLKMGSEVGNKAGLEGTLALESRANSGESYKPLSATTVTT